MYSSGYVIGEQTAYGGSGAIEHGAAGVTYIKNGEFIKKVRCCKLTMLNLEVYGNKYIMSS